MADGSGEIDIKALPKMVRWYSPSHLVSTGWRSVVSEIFGQYADQRREMLQWWADFVDAQIEDERKVIIGRFGKSFQAA